MLVLKQQLKEARIPQAVVARAVAVSEATLAQIVNHNEWPRTSPEEVRQRLALYLESKGIDTAKSFDAAQGAVTPRTAGTTDKTNLSEEENMLLKKQVLFPATKKAFGLFRDPFADEAMQGADDVFTTPDIRYVREALFQTARHGGFLAVIGESGAGKLEKVPEMLRPDKRLPCVTVTDSNSMATLQVQVKGYLERVIQNEEELQSSAEHDVCADIFRLCRGDSHLVFANSRKRTESIAATLSDMCEEQIVPNEFFPHHGSLAKELREVLESRLQKGNLPTTAVCTMTLELGIDIGKVKSVIQVTPPHSVSSLRQRMGRSGRRDSPSVLRMLITENELTVSSSIVDHLRLQLVQSMAMIRLMISKQWFEPADSRQMHYSTLLHQILAITAQWGGVRADQLWSQLCQTGPFRNVDLNDFKSLLKHMGACGLLTQLASGEMVVGAEGEKLTNHYTFYAVFNTPEEFRIITGNRTLGTVPVDSPLLPDQHIIFGGRRWKVTEIETEKKVIYVEATKGGQPPQFSGGGMSVHDAVRQEMLAIYREGDYRIAIGSKKVDYADTAARNLFAEGCSNFQRFKLQNECFITSGQHCYVIPWMGDKVVNTITALLIRCGFKANSFAGVIEIDNSSVASVQHALKEMLLSGLPSAFDLATDVPEKYLDKYDEYLPESLLAKGYGAKAYETEGTRIWLQKHL